MALKEDQRYGLSSRSLAHGGNNNNNISVFYVKLTDSAARAIDTFQNSKGLFSYPTICFSGKQGRITIPCAENRGDLRTFTFGLTNVARDNPHGSFNCVQQPSKCSAEEPLSCVGMIQEKLTVNATDDSYHKACQSMALVEEETRSRGAIVIKHEGRFKGKKVTVRAPSAALAKLAKPRHPSRSILGKLGKSPCVSTLTKSTSASDRKIACVNENRPLRERLIHLLALRPYKRPELVLRLQRDGLTPGDKDTVDTLLPEVAQHSRRDGAYVLKESLYKELHKDWPGYTTGDQQLLKRILVRRLFKPPSNLLSVPETQVSPLRDTPNSSPAHSLKHSLAEDYTDPLAIKKPRISHLTSKARNVRSEPQSIKQSTKVGTNATEVDNNRRNSLDPQKLLDSLTAVCEQEVDVVERLEPAPSYIKDSKNSEAFSQPNSDLTATPLNVPHLERPTRRKSKSKHRDQEKVKDRDRKGKRKGEQNSEELKSQVSVDCKGPSGMFYDSSVLKASDDMTDYLLKYTVICSHDQRQSYKQDFIEEYNEYRSLHACIDSVTRQFMALDVQLKKLHRGSHKYKTVHNQILQEYRKIKKSNPNYNEDKVRCEYLHNKLAHIKKLISEYDKSRSEKTADEGSALQSVPPTHSGTSQ